MIGGDDAFIRTHYNRRKPPAKRFQCRENETGVSLFVRREELADDKRLDDFQRECQLPSGDLPALLELLHKDIIGCGLSVRHDPNADHAYGHLHWVTTTCPTEDQASSLALIVAARAVLRPYIAAR